MKQYESHAMEHQDQQSSSLQQKLSDLDTETAASLIGGGALFLLGLSRQSMPGLLAMAVGGGLIYRSLQSSGMLNQLQSQMIEFEKSVVVSRPVEEVFEFWTNFENFPQFMEHISKVEKISEERSHWEALVPATNMTIDWDAEITEMRDNEVIAWRSVHDADIQNKGRVRFKRLSNGQGTEVQVRISYQAPQGMMGKVAAQFLKAIPANFVEEDIHRFKRLMESGEQAQLSDEAPM